MRTLNRIGISLIIIILGLVLISLFLPSKMQLEVRMAVEAPIEEVFQQVNNVKNWQKWSPWLRQYNDVTINYGDVTVGQGASYSWKSKRGAKGALSIVKSNSPIYIRTQQKFAQRRTTRGEWQLEQNGDSTVVVWAMETRIGYNPLEKYSGLLMKNTIRSDYQKGLENMKNILQNSYP